LKKVGPFAEIAVKNSPDVNEELSNLSLMKVIQDRRWARTVNRIARSEIRTLLSWLDRITSINGVCRPASISSLTVRGPTLISHSGERREDVNHDRPRRPGCGDSEIFNKFGPTSLVVGGSGPWVIMTS
jgi:hypothetical protein